MRKFLMPNLRERLLPDDKDWRLPSTGGGAWYEPSCVLGNCILTCCGGGDAGYSGGGGGYSGGDQQQGGGGGGRW